MFRKLRAPLTNHFWSWGAVRDDGTVFLRVWQDERRSHEGKHFIRLVNHAAYAEHGDSLGYAERLRHLQMIKNGAPAYLVLCRAVDTNANPREIASFDERDVLRLGEVIEIDGDDWGEIAERVKVANA
jgi:hypothetical protein